MSRLERFEHISPVKKVLGITGLGAVLFFGGKAMDHYDGQQESAPAATAELAGEVLLGWGVLRGLNEVAANQVLKMRLEQVKDQRRIAEGLPPNLRDRLDPVHILDRLHSWEQYPDEHPSVKGWVVASKLFGTNFTARRGAPYSVQVEAFHDDIRRVVTELADAKQGLGDYQGARIVVTDTSADIIPSDRDRLDDEMRQLAWFLDDAAPLAFDPESDRSKNNPDCWYSYISGQVGSEMINRLLEYGPTGIPAEI